PAAAMRLTLTFLHRAVNVPSCFVTLRAVTVPGRGGRPRKWRSDADRVRAYRARQRGAPEPPVLVVALDEGDELAAPWSKAVNSASASTSNARSSVRCGASLQRPIERSKHSRRASTGSAKTATPSAGSSRTPTEPETG